MTIVQVARDDGHINDVQCILDTSVVRRRTMDELRGGNGLPKAINLFGFVWNRRKHCTYFTLAGPIR
jgi:hypothetical protein